ncbi:MAG: monovalent cation/H+ antiporter subunit D family protein [Desulfohalobiaceae bacterium]|nr:monovalent cation/H+ antiporter subunit D family protein [Desulfohalobiaceae bacterium]
MDPVVSVRPLLAVLVSLAVVPVLLSSGGRPNVREAWTILAGLIKFGLIVSLVPGVLAGREFSLTLFSFAPGADIALRVDGLGLVFALVASFLWMVTSLYSIGYMRGLAEHSQTRFYCFFAVALSSTIGAAFAANLLTLYLFYEILSLSTYPLVTHHQDEEARKSGRKYLAYILGTSIGLVLPAMILSYNVAGTLEFSQAGIFGAGISPAMATVLLLVFLFGFAKAAIVPLHAWLPAAMVAPTPVSALLHAVAVVKVGAFSIVRVMTGIFGFDLLGSFHLGYPVAIIASVTIILGSLIALSQDELKRRLAFSTVSQLSYIVLGVALLTPYGAMGGILHIVMHALGKITLFFCAGAIMVATGKKYISEMAGIGKRMPLTMGAFFVGSLSIIGLPPCGGFISKWYLALGTLQKQSPLLLGVILTSSFLNAVYFLPIVYKAFFHGPSGGKGAFSVTKEPLMCVVPLLLTAAGSVVLFFWPQLFIDLIEIGLR